MQSTVMSGKSATDTGEASILDAAETLFAAQGFDSASMRAIAEKAGVSKANIFHHFGSKERLYFAVLNRAVSESVALIGKLGHSGGCCPERLTRFAGQHLEHLFERKSTTLLALRETLEGGSERGRELAEKVVGKVFSELVGLMKVGIEDGELRPDLDPALAATLLLGANAFFFEALTVLRHLPEVDFADDAQRYSAGVMDILLNGMATDGSVDR